MNEHELLALDSRKVEVAQYQANIDMYTEICTHLPSEWPERLLQYKDASDKHATAAQVEDLDDVLLLGDLWAYEASRSAIRAETIEMRKAQAVLNVLQAKFDAEQPAV